MGSKQQRWPFPVGPDARAATTKRIVHEGHPILAVVHDIDGDWEFIDNGPLELDDLMLVHLAHIVEHYPEVIEFADLPPGWEARRVDATSDWRRSPLTVEPN
ncbi:MAG: hypothetical protein E6I56_02835 [Chloroflexi bacterium]|nr:MAG: hypothetical protein E6I56_02835 [Chloroflexota bacterium]